MKKLFFMLLTTLTACSPASQVVSAITQTTRPIAIYTDLRGLKQGETSCSYLTYGFDDGNNKPLLLSDNSKLVFSEIQGTRFYTQANNGRLELCAQISIATIPNNYRFEILGTINGQDIKNAFQISIDPDNNLIEINGTSNISIPKGRLWCFNIITRVTNPPRLILPPEISLKVQSVGKILGTTDARDVNYQYCIYGDKDVIPGRYKVSLIGVIAGVGINRQFEVTLEP
jgi:hypothetical protein